MDAASFESAIARLPRWILALAAAGTLVAGQWRGLNSATGFLVGALCAYANFRIVERAVNRLARVAPTQEHPGAGTGTWIFIQFTGLILGAFVILRYSGFDLAAAFLGFLVCPAAVMLEIVYELVTLNFPK